MAGPFPAGVEFVPVPAPLLGGLLAEIDDLNELKVTLRAIWHIHQKKGVPRPLRRDELCADPSVAGALGAHGEELEQAVDTALDAAVRRGTLLRVDEGEDSPLYLLNTDPERRGVLRTMRGAALHSGGRAETWPAPADRPTVFALYEENIGPLTPVVADRLNEAQSTYPEGWIAEAIEVAAENGVRSWRYVAAILENRAVEGGGDGKPRRDSEEDRLAPYRRAWDKYVRRD